MLKYVTTATALKLFSISSETRQIYRSIGNTAGQKWRTHHGLESRFIERVKSILQLSERYSLFKDGDELLEIGTGWVHWESTIIRLFYDVKITLFDIWDNRNFDAYKEHCMQLDNLIDNEIKMDPVRSNRVHSLLKSISKARTFDEVYGLMQFQYLVNPTGSLKIFPPRSFDAVFSYDVMEHITEKEVPEFVQDIYRILRRNGYSIHHIDLADHLTYYDTSVSRKNYLRYSDSAWKRYFENQVQYINRIQYPSWIGLFRSCGFEPIEEKNIISDLGNLEIDRKYSSLSESDLRCVAIDAIHQKKF
jgi:hypothetical protein